MTTNPWIKRSLRLASIVSAGALFAVMAPKIFAQTGQPPSIESVSAVAEESKLAVNVMWMLITAFMVIFMQLGFALVQAGFTRSKNVVNTMMMNMMGFAIGILGYWACGFAFQFGTINYAWPAVETASAVPGAWAHAPVTLGAWGDLLATPLLKFGSQYGILGGSGFFLSGVDLNTGILTFFIFEAAFMCVALLIPTGAMAERLKFGGFCLTAMLISMFLYPLVGGWVWGGGWLQNIGRIAGYGNGVIDFAGSGVVHLTGGAIALAGAMVVGPRIGRFNADGSANAMPGHNIPLGLAGTIILWFCWFGFNPGSAYGITGGFGQLAANAAATTFIAAAAAAVAAMCYAWWIGPTKKPDAIMAANGLLGGLVAITTPCAFVDTTGALIIGLVAGVLVCIFTRVVEAAQIDDAVGAVPVHLVNGIWGTLAVGLFAKGSAVSANWNGVQTAVTGVFYGGTSQIIAQVIEVFAIFVPVFVLSFLFFKLLNLQGLLRVNNATEREGLDMIEMGSTGYSDEDAEPSAMGAAMGRGGVPTFAAPYPQQRPPLAPAAPYAANNGWAAPAPGFGYQQPQYGAPAYPPTAPAYPAPQGYQPPTDMPYPANDVYGANSPNGAQARGAFDDYADRNIPQPPASDQPDLSGRRSTRRGQSPQRSADDTESGDVADDSIEP